MCLSNPVRTQTTEKEMLQLKMSNAQNYCKTCKPITRFYSLYAMLQSGNIPVSLHAASSHQRHPQIYASLLLVPVHIHLIPQLQLERNLRQSSGHYRRNTWLIFFCFSEDSLCESLFHFSSPFEATRVKSLYIPGIKNLHGLIPLFYNQSLKMVWGDGCHVPSTEFFNKLFIIIY